MSTDIQCYCLNSQCTRTHLGNNTHLLAICSETFAHKKNVWLQTKMLSSDLQVRHHPLGVSYGNDAVGVTADGSLPSTPAPTAPRPANENATFNLKQQNNEAKG